MKPVSVLINLGMTSDPGSTASILGFRKKHNIELTRITIRAYIYEQCITYV